MAPSAMMLSAGSASAGAVQQRRATSRSTAAMLHAVLPQNRGLTAPAPALSALHAATAVCLQAAPPRRCLHVVHADAKGAATLTPDAPQSSGDAVHASAAASTQPQQEQQQQQQGQPASSTTAGRSAQDVASVSPRVEAQLTLEQYKEIYDRLISIFQQRPRDDWKKLIVFSKQWPQHQQGVFDRVKELADKEGDVDKKMALRKLFRGLQGVNEEVKRYSSILTKLTEAADDEWEPIVTVHRGDLQRGFFEHMQCLIAAAKKEGQAADIDRLVMMNTRLVGLCASYDSVAKDQGKLEQAAEVYRDLLTSIESLEDADKKMAELASQGKIDPAFLQISAKAYGAARDTNMTLDEAKWVSYKLYRNAKDHFDRQQPTEKRIIEYLCSIPDPRERINQLDQAVTPGPTRETDTHAYMWSTPTRLYIVLDTTLQAYQEMQEAAKTRLNTSEESITPRKIRVMRELRDEIRKRYL